MNVDFDLHVAAATVVVEGTDWVSGSHTNLFTNPSFEASGSTVEVRRNLAADPCATTMSARPAGSAGWMARWYGGSGGAGVTTLVTGAADGPEISPGVRIPSYIRKTWTVGGGTNDTGFDHLSASVTKTTADTSGLPVTPGVTYTFSSWVRASRHPAGASVDMRVVWRDTAGAQILPVPARTLSAITPGEWQRVFTTVTAPATAATVSIATDVYGHIGMWAPGDVLDGTALLIEQSSAPRAFFAPGLPSYDSDLTPSWTGAVNGSASVLTGRRAAGASVGWQSEHWSATGGKSLFVPEGSVQEHAITSQTLAIIPRDTNQMILVNDTPQSTQEITRIIGPATVGLPHGWWDVLTIVEGNHPGLMPFDGSTKPASIPGSTVMWNGAPNASTSTLTVPTVNRVIVERNSGSGWVQVRGGARDVLGGFLVITDQEMPLHTTVQYRVRGYNGSAGVATLNGSVSTAVSGPKAFIKKASDPNATCAVTIILDALTVSSATQGGTYDVLNGGAVAVAAWSGVNADRFTLPVRTYTLQERQELEALLETRVLLFQSCADEPFRSGWYFVESVQRSLRGGGQILEGAEYSLSLIATGVPSGDSAGVSGASYAQVASIYTLYSDLSGTYFDVLQVA